jgi:hypothetical protein
LLVFLALGGWGFLTGTDYSRKYQGKQNRYNLHRILLPERCSRGSVVNARLDFIWSTREHSPSTEQSKAQSDYTGGVRRLRRVEAVSTQDSKAQLDQFAVAAWFETG